MTRYLAGFLCGHLREIDYLKNIGVDGQIILNDMRRNELD